MLQFFVLAVVFCSPTALSLTYNDIAPTALSTTTVPWDTVFVDYHKNFMAQLVQNFPQGVVFSSRNPQFIPQWGEQNLMDSLNGGVAVLDFDGDGDDDILIVGPTGTPNLLFRNDFDGTTVSFTEVAAQNGIGDATFDGTGVCYADVDNDGDLDIVVLALRSQPRLFIRGSSGYTMITSAFTAVRSYAPMMSCSFGDFSGDGYQDLVISTGGNATKNCRGLDTEELDDFIFINDGTGLVWTDESATRGFRDPSVPKLFGWHVNAFDFDQDGDLDIIIATDQCQNGIVGNKTYLLVYENDGTGYFNEVSSPAMDAFNGGSWMGVTAADFNGDGNLDIFLTNIGDMFFSFVSGGGAAADRQTKPLFGTRPSDPSNPRRFEDLYPSPQNDPIGTAFGWAGLSLDIDNDGDTDVVYHGSLNEKAAFFSTNPGVYLENDGTGNFTYHNLFEARVHQRRVVRGAAAGDFNGDGFPDIVTFAPVTYTSTFPQVIPIPPLTGKQLDRFNFQPPLGIGFGGTVNNLGLMDLFPEVINHDWGLGDIAVEMSSGDNGNNWIRVGLRGTHSARDGIGSIVSVFRCATSAPNANNCNARMGNGQIMPYANGAFMSQGSLVKNFGLKDSGAAEVEVFWPTGKTNILKVSANPSSPVIVPEIVCDIKTVDSFQTFKSCLNGEISRLNQIAGLNVPSGYKADMIGGYQFYHSAGAATAGSGTAGGGTATASQGMPAVGAGILIGFGGCFVGLAVGVLGMCWRDKRQADLKNAVEMQGQPDVF